MNDGESWPRLAARVVRNLGPVGALWFYAQSWRQQHVPPRSAFTVRSRYARYPLLCRQDTSDWDVFKQVFVDLQYDCFPHAPAPGLILDCGANVGYASAWFLSAFPSCHVLAVEPDPDNFRSLLANLRPYGARASAVHGAVWSHDTTLALASDRFSDGREWSRHVHTDLSPDGVAVPAFSIPNLLARCGADRVSILKMDIEGAETVVFSDNPVRWLSAVDALAIELHPRSHFGDPAAPFGDAMRAAGFGCTRAGELTVCLRPQRDAASSNP